jgi:hypothetical protein
MRRNNSGCSWAPRRGLDKKLQAAESRLVSRALRNGDDKYFVEADGVYLEPPARPRGGAFAFAAFHRHSLEVPGIYFYSQPLC